MGVFTPVAYTDLSTIKLSPGDSVRLARGCIFKGGLKLVSGVTVEGFGDPTQSIPVVSAVGRNAFEIWNKANNISISGVTVEAPNGIPGRKEWEPKGRRRYAGLMLCNTVENLMVSDVSFQGFALGINYEFQHNGTSRNHKYTRVKFLDNWSTDGQYDGQGIYLVAVDTVAFLQCLWAGNGMVPLLAGAGWKRTMYRHGGYLAFGEPHNNVPPATNLSFVECSAIDNAAFAWQNRFPPSSYFRCFCANNANGILVNGDGAFYSEDCGFVCDGAYDEQQGPGGSWVKTGGSAYHVHAKDATVTRALMVQPAPVAKYPAAAIQAGQRGGNEGWEYKGQVDLKLDGVVYAGTFPRAVDFVGAGNRTNVIGTPIRKTLNWNAKQYDDVKRGLRSGQWSTLQALGWLRTCVS